LTPRWAASPGPAGHRPMHLTISWYDAQERSLSDPSPVSEARTLFHSPWRSFWISAIRRASVACGLGSEGGRRAPAACRSADGGGVLPGGREVGEDLNPALTLAANSIPYSRGRLQRGESRAAGPGQRRTRPPLTEPHHVVRRRRLEVLKVRLRLPHIATPPQPAPVDRLFMPTLDAGPGRVPRAEFLRRLLAAGRLQRLVRLTG
jgi:hypothetical protein